MSTAITGGYGFLGWHLACRILAQTGNEPFRLGRADFAQPERLASALATVDTIYHVAGVNRADSDEQVTSLNIQLAKALSDAIIANGRPVRLVYANSIQSRLDNPYGRGKAAAVPLLANAVERVGGTMVNVLLPNLFGEHGRPNYNSVVATFAAKIAAGEEPTVTHDKEIPLLHAQDAAQALIDAATGNDQESEPPGRPTLVSSLIDTFRGFESLYRVGEIPALDDPFQRDLFNAYRSYLFPERFPIPLQVHSDQRGDLFETLRYHGGTVQTYLSTTRPGQKRGEHYHLRKVERFVVVKGEAEIGFRKLLTDDVVTIRVSGDNPSIVDMPTLWVHNLVNVGDTELITYFFSDQLLDPANPDQFYATVQPEEISA